VPNYYSIDIKLFEKYAYTLLLQNDTVISN